MSSTEVFDTRCGHAHRRTRLALAAASAAALLLAAASDANAQQPGRAAYELGAHALRSGDADRAVEQLRRAYESAADNPAVLGMYARALLMNDRPNEAVAVLDRLREVQPEAEDLDLLAGLARYRQRQWSQALMHLTSARERSPRSSRVYLFLAATYQELGRFRDAEQALADAERIDPTLDAVVSYRRAIAAARQGRAREAADLLEGVQSRLGNTELGTAAGEQLELLRAEEASSFNTYAAVGFEVDSNNNLAGDVSSFVIHSEKDVRAVVQAGMQGFLYQGESFVVRGGIEGYLSEQRDLERLNIQSPSAFVRASYALADSVTLDLGYAMEYTWADMDSFRRAQTFSPAIRIRYAERFATRLSLRQQKRAFFLDRTSPALDRDGDVTLAGIEQLYYLGTGGGGVLRAGMFYRHEDTSGPSFDSRGPLGLLSMTLTSTSGISLLAEGRYEIRRHDNRDAFDTSLNVGTRSDRILSGRISLRAPLTELIAIQADFERVHNGSNTPAFDYDRNVASLRFLYLR